MQVAGDGAVARSPALDDSLQQAHRLAVAQGHGVVALEHLLFALTEDGDAVALMAASNTNLDRLRADASAYLGRLGETSPMTPGQAPAPGADLLRILQLAALAARQSQRRQIDSAIVLAAIIGDGNSPAAGMLKSQGLTFEEVIRVLQQGTVVRPADTPAPPAAPPPAPPQPPPQLPTSAEAYLASARARVKQVEPATVRTTPTRPVEPPPAPVPPPAETAARVDGLATFRPPIAQPPAPPPAPPPLPATPTPAPPPVASWQTPAADPPPVPVARPAMVPSAQAPMPALLPRQSVDIVAAATGLPALVRIGEPILVEIRIPRGEVDVPRATARPGVAPINEPPVYRVVTVRLTANTGAISIEPRSPETIWLEPSLGPVADDVIWQFLLTPMRRGTIPVALTVSGRTISAYGVMADQASPSETFAVTVRRARGSLVRRFFKALLLIGVGAAATWALFGPLAAPLRRLLAAALG